MRTGRLRVGINLCWLVPGIVGGSEEATTRVLRAIADDAPSDVEIVLFGQRSLHEAHPDLVERFETHTARVPGGSKALRVLAEHTWLRLAVRRHRIDLVHDAGGTSPGRIGVPRVLTIHDIQPLELPRNFSPVKVVYLRWAIPHAVSGASRVLVPSDFVRERLVERLGADPARIDVVPWTVPEPDEGTPIEAVRARYGIIGSIVLVPGITYPHKDHVVAIRAMRHIASRHGETTMVLTGGEGPSEATVLAEIEAQGMADRIVRTGRVPGPVISALFRHATMVLVPSRYEGFGVPALEAMAVGTPVVVADAGALPEVVGAGGVVVPAGDDAQLAVEMHRILSDPEHRRSLSTAGRERATAFGPPVAASATLAAYRSAAADL